MWRISRSDSIIRWQDYRVSASRLAESNFRYTHRLDCPPDSRECEGQPPGPEGDGCHSEEIDRWSNNIVLEHSMPRAGPKMSNLPAACWEVLNPP
jgi:penicillin-insensitive murein DD-endopeptidase